MKIPMRLRVVLIAGAVLLLLFLLLPGRTVYLDEGTTTYSAPLYSITHWCSPDGNQGTEVRLLPHLLNRPIYSSVQQAGS